MISTKHINECKLLEKIAIFVDVQNIYYTTRQAYSQQFNYRRFWQHINHQGDIVMANAYAIDKGDEQQQKFNFVLVLNEIVKIWQIRASVEICSSIKVIMVT